jgi:hypothetical protein
MTQDQREALFPESGASEGLSWSWHLDLETLLAALSEPAPWNRARSAASQRPEPGADSGTDLTGPDPGQAGPISAAAEPAVAGLSAAGPLAGSTAWDSAVAPVDPVEAEFAEYLDAVDAGRSSVVPLSVAAGRVAEILPTSPDLAAWLACNPAGDLEDGALAGEAAGYRRLAAWAQAGELAVVAQMASRSAAADKYTETGEDGRPAKVPADAYGQVSLALTMSQAGAEWWTNLAVDLQWRLAATGLALRDGVIDLARARAIAEATGPLDDAKARAVEAKVLPRAGEQTTGQLRASLRRAVITADPEGAERRREQAERRAKVVLYPDAEGTASLSGQNLPGIRAAAAFARITALARALKAAGSDGGIDLLRSKVLLGLLLGTLPYIPPPPDAPPDPTGPPDGGGPPGFGGGPVGSGAPSGTGLAGGQPAGPGADSSPHLDDWPWDNDLVRGRSSSGEDSVGSDSSEPGFGDHAVGGGPEPDEDSAPDPDAPPEAGDQPEAMWDGVDGRSPAGESPALGSMTWPDATPFLPPGPAALKNLQPAGSGFLDLRLPWLTLTQGGPEPGYLTRLGPVTPAQASYLAVLAAADPVVEWRAVITDDTGRVIAVTRIRTPQARAGPVRASPGTASSLVRRVTVIISTVELSAETHDGQCPDETVAAVAAAIITAALQAADRAAGRAAADAAAGGCAHAQASAAYQVPARVREFVNLRDLTCRFPTCRQPAQRCDADHTKPYDQGGPTCACNLGALCRFHHQLKQHRQWRLDQPVPGTFTWTTPTGRTYEVQPDPQAA